VLTREQLFAENQRLKAELLAQQAELLAQQKALQERDARVAQLQFQLDYLKRKLFGTGKSEKLDARQRELTLGEIEQVEQDLQKISVPAHEREKRKAKPSRQERYEHLPVKDTVEIIPDEVRADPDAYERTGAVEETFEIDYIEAEFFRRQILRPKFRRKDDRSRPLVVAPAKPRVVEGLASANLLALIMVSKFVDHLPLHRQAKIYKRHGCEFSASSMVRWVGKVGDWLKPVYDHMAWELLQGNYLQADETPIQFCDPDLGLKKTRQGYFCVYSVPGGHVVFVWRKGRKSADVVSFLSGFQGLLQTDAYAPYIAFAKDNADITLLGCMAHARRYFDRAYKYNRRECDLVLRLIGRLYALEKEIRTAVPALEPEQVVAMRQAKATTTLRRLKRVLQFIQRTMKPQQPVRGAADYAMAHWEYLIELVHHGEDQIDNNLVENAIRPTAVGKKNWLFIGHPNAGDRAAIIYSILISCQRLGVDPQAYLRFVLEQPTAELSREQLAGITPRAFAQASAQDAAAA